MKAIGLGLVMVGLSVLAGSPRAEAKCSIRVGDPLITQRYQDCNRRTFLSYLYNDLVTPFSFKCAKKLSAKCREANCANPQTEEETQRCLGTYVEVLNECEDQIGDAARMAQCKDTKVWPVPALNARAPVMGPPEPPGALTQKM